MLDTINLNEHFLLKVPYLMSVRNEWIRPGIAKARMISNTDKLRDIL